VVLDVVGYILDPDVNNKDICPLETVVVNFLHLFHDGNGYGNGTYENATQQVDKPRDE
jgi:hypothetical protein